MTQETAELLNLIDVFEVRVEVRNVHEINRLETKMRRHGLIRTRHYEEGPDDWNRPTIVRASYIVLVKRDRVQPFKAMLKQLSRGMASRLTYANLSNSL